MPVVTDKMKQAGEEMAEHLTDAAIRSSMGGLGGCGHYNIEDFPFKYRYYIKRYLEDSEYSSVMAIYQAMENARIEE